MVNSVTLPELPSIDSVTLAKLAASAYELLCAGNINQSEVLCRAILSYSKHNFNALRIFRMIYEHKEQAQLPFAYLSEEEITSQSHKERSRLIHYWLDCGLEFHRKNQFAEAAIIYCMVLAYDQRNAVAIQLLGVYEDQQGHGDAAIKHFDAAIAIKPDYAAAYNNRGNALRDMKRYEEALASYNKAIAIKPDYADAYYNHGNVLGAMKRHEEALASYNKAIAIKPDYVDAYNNRGNTLCDLKRHEEALADYGNAIALKPDYAGAHWNESVLSLLLGDFECGWKKFEWRWIHKPTGENPRHTAIPLWLGKENLSGKTILLWSEQGFGDTIQFCRFARHVAHLGAKVVLEVPQALVNLLSGIDGVDRIIAIGGPLPEIINYQCPLMSLPLALKLSLPDITGAPYLKHPSEKPWIQAMTLACRSIGVAWSGSIGYNASLRSRSIPFSKFISLLPDELSAVCLQKEIRETDRSVLSSYANIQIVSQHLNDFSDTAALIGKLDLVITVDTSVAHLAGAMGKDVWILLPYAPDWRWLLDRTDSPWYGSATLFRQPKLGDWDSVLMGVNQRLRERYSNKGNHHEGGLAI